MRLPAAEGKIFDMKPPTVAQPIHLKIDDIAYTCASGAEGLKWYIEFRTPEDLQKMETKLAVCLAELAQAIEWVAEIVPPATPTDEVALIATAAPTPQYSRTNQVANIRSGPSTNYEISETVDPGHALLITGRNEAGDWYELDNDKWIAAFLVDAPPDNLPIVSE